MGDSRCRPQANHPYFLVIDTRFTVPVFVFLDSDPTEVPGYAGPRVRRVTLTRMEDSGSFESVQPGSTIGADPWGTGRYAEFASDGHARAAGYAPVEPRYVGPDWASYSSVFHPEGSKDFRSPADPLRRARGRNGPAHR
jgi:hypothetical protein